jgi:hypothetical protein
MHTGASLESCSVCLLVCACICVSGLMWRTEKSFHMNPYSLKIKGKGCHFTVEFLLLFVHKDKIQLQCALNHQIWSYFQVLVVLHGINRWLVIKCHYCYFVSHAVYHLYLVLQAAFEEKFKFYPLLQFFPYLWHQIFIMGFLMRGSPVLFWIA